MRQKHDTQNSLRNGVPNQDSLLKNQEKTESPVKTTKAKSDCSLRRQEIQLNGKRPPTFPLKLLIAAFPCRFKIGSTTRQVFERHRANLKTHRVGPDSMKRAHLYDLFQKKVAILVTARL